MLLLLTAALASEPVCDICFGGQLKPDTLPPNSAFFSGYSEDNSPYTCQVAQYHTQTAQDTPCSELQATWGQTCCEINLASLANYSDANASAAEVLAGLQLCFDEGVIADGEGLARLSNPACITAWATLCVRDEILGEWMQERVQSRGSRLCNQVPSWARGERLAKLISWYYDGTLEMLSYAATQLGITWVAAYAKEVSDFCAISLDTTILFQWLWGPWIVALGANTSSGGTWPSLSDSDAAIYTQLHMRFLEQKVDGPVLCTLSAADITQIGVPFGTANNWRTGMDDYLYTTIERPLGATAYDPNIGSVRTYYPPRSANVSITMVLDDLYNINELDFSFSIGFTLIRSWEDDRISTRCAAVGSLADNSLPSDLCNHYWQPKITWPNVFQYDEGEFEVVEELGFYTEVGLGAVRAEPHNKNANLEHSIGYRIQRIKGHFVTPMGFKHFPFDCQSLLVTVRASGDDASIYRFVPSSTISARLRSLLQGGSESANTIAGWNISAINHQERLFTSKSTVDIFGFNRFDSPTLSEITADGQVDYKTNELEVPYYNNVSEAIFSISIKREPHSFIFNFAALVGLLLSISFSSFLLPNDDMNGRITIALTVFLGVIFFQILIVESLPRTSNFTTMHMFMFLSSIFNGIIVLEHALVYALNAWVGKRAALVIRIKKLQRNVRVVRHAIRLQRAFRNHRIDVMHQQIILAESSKASTRVPASAPASSRPASVEATGVAVDEERFSGIAVDVGIAREPSFDLNDVDDLRNAVPSSRSYTRNYSQQLELRLTMANRMTRKPTYRERKTAMMRKVYDMAAVFLEDANRFFAISTMAAYFIGVFFLTFLDGDRDAKCDNPWSTLF